MGMYDYVIPEYPFPDLPPLEVVKEWQCKDLEQNMSTFRISSEGLLYRTDGHGIYKPTEEEKNTPLNYTGELNFYTATVPKFTDKTYMWHEYEMIFVHGRLQPESIKVMHAPRVNLHYRPVRQIPSDWPVQPFGPFHPPGRNIATCMYCGLSWDDAKVTSLTPAPGGRCPFEPFHIYE